MVRHVVASLRRFETAKQKETTHMKRKRVMLLSSVLGAMLAISAIGFMRTARAECSCACFYNCSDQACYSSVDGDNVADCIRCVAQCCALAQKVAHCHGEIE